MPNLAVRLWSPVFVVLVAVAALFVPVTAAQPVGEGATIIVSSTDDIVADDGLCSLREAITSANQDEAVYESVGECISGMGPDTIVLPTGVYAIAIADPDANDENNNVSGDFDIKSELTISGVSAAATQISGTGLDRVFHIQASATVHIEQIRIFEGRTNNASTEEVGTGESGGGILNEGTLTLVNVQIDNNETGTGSAIFGTSNGGNGGGIFNLGGILLIVGSYIENNSTGDGGMGLDGRRSGAGGFGAGIATISGQVYVWDSSISFNRGGNGGVASEQGLGGVGGEGAGIFTFGGTLYVAQSDIGFNQTGDGGTGNNEPDSQGLGGSGGGIFNAYGSTAIEASTIHGNKTGSGSAGGNGGGIYLSDQLWITDSTISLNHTGSGPQSSGNSGAGIFVANTGVLSLVRSAIVLNQTSAAGTGGGIHMYGKGTIFASIVAQNYAWSGNLGTAGGIMVNQHPPFTGSLTIQDSIIAENGAAYWGGVNVSVQAALTLRNTIIANNIATDDYSDCGGSLLSQGYLIVEDNTGCVITGTTTGNQIGVDPALSTLVQPEDEPPFYTLLTNSPALDAGNCPQQLDDQRHNPRPIDLPPYVNVSDGCDIGAIEAQLVEVSPHHLFVSERGITDTYTLTLAYTPTAPVTITLSVADQITVTPEFVVITPTLWTLPHTITVSAIDDNEDEGPHTDFITHTATSSDPIFDEVPIADVIALITDDETNIPPLPTPIPTSIELGSITQVSSTGGVGMLELAVVGVILLAGVAVWVRRHS